MRLIFATQVVDPADPVLGATVPKLHALAGRVDELVVLADRAVDGVLPANCRVRLFGSQSQVGRVRLFLDGLRRELRPRPVAFVAHMVPRYALLAAPLTLPAPGADPALVHALEAKPDPSSHAERLFAAVLSVDRRSFPLALGEGRPHRSRHRHRRLRLHGARCVGGPAARRRPRSHVSGEGIRDDRPRRRAGRRRARDPRHAGSGRRARRARAARRSGRPRSRIRSRTPTCPRSSPLKDVLVDNMREGALDKVVYEAAATCLPVLASNSGFDDVLPPELRFARHDPEDLAEKLRALVRGRPQRSRPPPPGRGRGAPLGRPLGRAPPRGRAARLTHTVTSPADAAGDCPRSRPGGTCPRKLPPARAAVEGSRPSGLARSPVSPGHGPCTHEVDGPQPWLRRAGPLQRRGPRGEGRVCRRARGRAPRAVRRARRGGTSGTRRGGAPRSQYERRPLPRSGGSRRARA